MTKDWVHGVGHSPVCQILLQIVARAVITPSPPAWTSSAGMLSTPTDDSHHMTVIPQLSSVFHSINSSDYSPLSHSVLPVLFLPHWSFNYISLYENLLLP